MYNTGRLPSKPNNITKPHGLYHMRRDSSISATFLPSFLPSFPKFHTSLLITSHRHRTDMGASAHLLARPHRDHQTAQIQEKEGKKQKKKTNEMKSTQMREEKEKFIGPFLHYKKKTKTRISQDPNIRRALR